MGCKYSAAVSLWNESEMQCALFEKKEIAGLKVKLPVKCYWSYGASQGFNLQAFNILDDVNICIFKLMSTDHEIVLFGRAQSIKLKLLLTLLERYI